MRYSIDTCNLTRKRVQSQVLPEVVALEIVIVEGADSLLQLRWELLVAHVLLVEHSAEWKLNRFIDSATIINLKDLLRNLYYLQLVHQLVVAYYRMVFGEIER